MAIDGALGGGSISSDWPYRAGGAFREVILLTGFGPFLDVETNPSSTLVRSCHGLRVGGETIISRVLDASYRRGISETIKLAEAMKPRLVLGTGLSRRDPLPRLESFAYSDYSQSLTDVDGQVGRPQSGPARAPATVDVRRLSAALDVALSTDPGRYVCNAWLYEVSLAVGDVPVGFLHIPVTGFETPRLLSGLSVYLGGEGSV